MEHSEEYYKMKYFKYKAKYQQAKQTGGFGFSRPQWTKGREMVKGEAKLLIDNIYKVAQIIKGTSSYPKWKSEFIAAKVTFDKIDKFIKYLKETLNVEDGDANSADLKLQLKNIYDSAKKICTPMIGNKFLGICMQEII